MTDLTPSAAELAAITLNGRRLTPEQSSWLVGSLQHERAYCSTPGELLELLSHPTPPPAPEVEAIRQRHLDDGSLLCPAEDHEAMRAAFAQRLFADVGTMLAAYDASVRCHLMVEEQKVKKSKEAYEQRQRAEAAERAEQEAKAEYDRLYALANDARLALNEAGCRGYDMTAMVKQLVAERDEAREALRTAQYGYRTMRGMLAKERTSATPAAPSELAGTWSVEADLRFAIQGITDCGPVVTTSAVLRLMNAAERAASALSASADNVELVEALRAIVADICGRGETGARLSMSQQRTLREAASALSTPGSEAPMVAALRERVRELKYALRDVFSEAREHIPEDLAKDARAQIDFDESTLTPLPASPAAGKEAM